MRSAQSVILQLGLGIVILRNYCKAVEASLVTLAQAMAPTNKLGGRGVSHLPQHARVDQSKIKKWVRGSATGQQLLPRCALRVNQMLDSQFRNKPDIQQRAVILPFPAQAFSLYPPSLFGATMARPKSKAPRAWTKDDIRALKTLAKQKTPIAKIARALKRTESATRQKAYAIGVSLRSRG